MIDLDDRDVVGALTLLEQQGFTRDVLLECIDLDIDAMANILPSPFHALKLKLALRKERQRLQEKLEDEELYRKFLPVVGRVQVSFKDSSQSNVGNCVLVANPGMAVSALHILDRKMKVKRKDPKDDKGKDVNEASSSRKRARMIEVEMDVPIKDIKVIFPNTSGGVLIYEAEILASSSVNDDLALIGPKKECLPFSKEFKHVQTLERWVPYDPMVNDKVILLSYPACKGEDRFSHCPKSKQDLPWFDKGVVTCVDGAKGMGFASYQSFGGASGALIIHPIRGGVKAAIHVGAYHESEEVPSWHPANLCVLNESLFQKACNGYFSLNTGKFLVDFFGSGHDAIAQQHLHHQVVRVKRKESVEVLDDLFGPWTDLDDDDSETAVKGVPKFWLNAMKANDKIAMQITERDEEALKHLQHMKWSKMEDSRSFKLEFLFDKNPFFKNTKLIKEYHMIGEDGPILKRIFGTEIEWHAGKNLTHTIMRKKVKKGAKTKRVMKLEACKSFFQFFSPPQVVEDIDQEKGMMQQEYEIGLTIRDLIIQHAMSGEAIEGEAGSTV